MIKYVYAVGHDFEIPESLDNGRYLGFYTTRELAEAAKYRALSLPGFSQFPEELTIDTIQLGEDRWTTGFFKYQRPDQ
jgi:hypothetical protein